MRAFYCDHFVLPLPDEHRFPMKKYGLLRERLVTCTQIELSVPDAATDEQLSRVHGSQYLTDVTSGRLTRDEVRRIGFPWSPELVERSRRSVGGTIAASRAATEDGLAANMAGGTHHAFADHGEGFCVFNDVAVAIQDARCSDKANRFTVIDLDVHQGNGTASIFTSDPGVVTLSVHGQDNYPFRKQVSDLDIGLADGTSDTEYLEAVAEGLRRSLQDGADLAFYIAGADPFRGDKLGRLNVSKDALAERDRLVFDRCEEAGIPVAIVMSGGYAEDVTDTVDIHEATLLEAADRTRRKVRA